jgi:hypothetical protein
VAPEKKCTTHPIVLFAQASEGKATTDKTIPLATVDIYGFFFVSTPAALPQPLFLFLLPKPFSHNNQALSTLKKTDRG